MDGFVEPIHRRHGDRSVIATAISFMIGKPTDAIMILIIVILNALLGFLRNIAERAMEALKKLSVPTVKVRRDNQVKEVDATSLVPGDIILLEAGIASLQIAG